MANNSVGDGFDFEPIILPVNHPVTAQLTNMG
jgi:hypothetical protein